MLRVESYDTSGAGERLNLLILAHKRAVLFVKGPLA